MCDLSFSRLNNLLTYVPETGAFWWKVSRGRSKSGTVAGVLCKQRGYIRIMIDGISFHAHRLAWYAVHGTMPEGEIDHINGIKRDNRIINLRSVDRSTNNQNRSRFSTNTSGCTGVLWDKKAQKWRANIGFESKLIHLGLFGSFDEAKKCRKKAEQDYRFHYNHGKLPHDRAVAVSS